MGGITFAVSSSLCTLLTSRSQPRSVLSLTNSLRKPSLYLRQASNTLINTINRSSRERAFTQQHLSRCSLSQASRPSPQPSLLNALGNAIVNNNCNSPVYLWPIDAQRNPSD